MTHRSAKAEWQPHRAQTTTSQEWWYFTALLHDASGNRYMLFSTIFKYDGKDVPIVKGAPEFASKLGPNATIISHTVELSNYDTGFHTFNSDAAIVDPTAIWNSKSNTLSYTTPQYTGSWSFNGQNLTAVLKSPKMSFDLNMQGGNQVMWAKDAAFNKEGFLQQGIPGNVSFYYSLPRLIISGKLSYTNESGTNKTIDVVGQGWVDRQWGDFKTQA
jgi:predicted secreted hydrolase